ERVQMQPSIVDTDLDGPIEGDRFADLRARVRIVILLVDRGALDLQEEPRAAGGWLFQQLDRLRGHLRDARFILRPVALRADLRGRGVTLVWKGLAADPLRRH